MTFIFNDGIGSSLNQTPSTAGEAIFSLKNLLKQAGWTVPKSSDGSTYNDSGDQITSGDSGSNGINNAYAWFVIQMPSSNRSFCFQRTSSSATYNSRYWRIKYSKGAGFDGGSPSATQVPSATDEQVLMGTGTDGSPGFEGLFSLSDGIYRFHCCADNASPYGWMSWAWASTSGLTCMGLGLDPLIATNSLDDDPYAIVLSSNLSTDSSFTRISLYHTSSRMLYCWLGSDFFNNGDQPGCGAGPPQMIANGTYDSWIYGGNNPFSQKDDILPLTLFINYQTTYGKIAYKGVLTITKALMQSDYRSTGSLYSVSSSKDSVLVRHCILPWDGSSTPLI